MCTWVLFLLQSRSKTNKSQLCTWVLFLLQSRSKTKSMWLYKKIKCPNRYIFVMYKSIGKKNDMSFMKIGHCWTLNLSMTFVNISFTISQTKQTIYFCDPYHLTSNLIYTKGIFKYFENLTIWPPRNPYREGGKFSPKIVKIFSDQWWLQN